jgi:hypothetical protein
MASWPTPGVKVYDVTDPEKPARHRRRRADQPMPVTFIISRTYAYVAAGKQGLVILDVEKPQAPKLDQIFSRDPATGIVLDDVTR